MFDLIEPDRCDGVPVSVEWANRWLMWVGDTLFVLDCAPEVCAAEACAVADKWFAGFARNASFAGTAAVC